MKSLDLNAYGVEEMNEEEMLEENGGFILILYIRGLMDPQYPVTYA